MTWRCKSSTDPARVSIASWNLKEAAGKALARRTEIAYEAATPAEAVRTPGPRACTRQSGSRSSKIWAWCHLWTSTVSFKLFHEPPCTEPYARWCGRTAGATPPPTRSNMWNTLYFLLLLCPSLVAKRAPHQRRIGDQQPGQARKRAPRYQQRYG